MQHPWIEKGWLSSAQEGLRGSVRAQLRRPLGIQTAGWILEDFFRVISLGRHKL